MCLRYVLFGCSTHRLIVCLIQLDAHIVHPKMLNTQFLVMGKELPPIQQLFQQGLLLVLWVQYLITDI